MPRSGYGIWIRVQRPYRKTEPIHWYPVGPTLLDDYWLSGYYKESGNANWPKMCPEMWSLLIDLATVGVVAQVHGRLTYETQFSCRRQRMRNSRELDLAYRTHTRWGWSVGVHAEWTPAPLTLPRWGLETQHNMKNSRDANLGSSSGTGGRLSDPFWPEKTPNFLTKY